MTLKRSLLLGLAAVLLVALLPAGLWLDRTLTAALRARAHEDLALAPTRLADRNQARGDALMMHAKEAAALPGLGAALAAGPDRAVEMLTSAGVPPGEVPVLLDSEGTTLLGPTPGRGLFEATREGGMPVGFVSGDSALWVVSLAPVMEDVAFRGAAGVAAPLDASTAASLGVLTAADVVLLDDTRRVVASTLEDPVAVAVVRAWEGTPETEDVLEVPAEGRRWWVVSSPLGGVGAAVFALDAGRELALLPRLRRGALAAGGLALLLALALGTAMAARLSRPVAALADAADRLARGDFEAPLPDSQLREVRRVRRAFENMRAALSARLAELSQANRELAQREERLQALQAEMIQRDRLTAAGRLVAELAHEIRNPVANVRNCLEVIRRRGGSDPELVRFAELAIDELLRMHEMAEHMLDLNRPIDPGASRCDVGEVLARTVSLLRAGRPAERWPTTLDGTAEVEVPMAPDVLKQVLLSLVENAREAMPAGGPVEIRTAATSEGIRIEVMDQGPGIGEEVLPRVFDPFFTTKGVVHGVGLGLFIAEGLVRRSGGRLLAGNRSGGGARFTLELPTAHVEHARGRATGGVPDASHRPRVQRPEA